MGYVTTRDVASACDWSSPRLVHTKRGERLLRTARPTEDFWELWRADKDALKAIGVQVTKTAAGEWQVAWWMEPGKDLADVGEPEPVAPANEPIEPLQDDRLLPWQREHAGRLLHALRKYRGALDASDTGTGKTYTACAVAASLGAPIYVVSPKAVLPTWRRVAHLFGVNVRACNYELLRRGRQPAVSRSKDKRGVQFEWHLPAHTLIIFDECHRCKNPDALNTKMALAAVRQGYRVLALSATAADNPMHMKFICALTGIADERSYWKWALTHGATKSWFGKGFTFSGSRIHLRSIHEEVFGQGRGSRMRIAELGDAFPATQIVAEAYDLGSATGHIRRVYDECAARIAELRRQQANAVSIMTEMLRARQEVELLKTDAIAEMARDAIDEGMSAAIFVNFNETVDRLQQLLKTEYVIRGGQTAEERERAIARFQADQSHVIICNIQAGGVGVSLHGSATGRMRLALIAPTWSAQDLKQALGRVHRAGGARSLQRIIYCADTIEEAVCKTVAEKLARIDAINDGILTPSIFAEAVMDGVS